MTTASTYLLDASSSERERLIFQSELFRPESEWLLDRCAIQPGWRVLEVACGPLGIMDLLSERVGPRGEVVGLDKEPRMLEMARESVAERALENVRLASGDAIATGQQRASFDFAHARLLLVNVSDPQAVVDEMAAMVRPGGMVAVQDIDWISRICEPAHPAWDRLIGALAELWRGNGMDVYIGRRLPDLLRRGGLSSVEVRATTRVFRRGDPYHTLIVSRTEQCRDALVDRGLITETELEECIASLTAHLDEPGTITLHGTFFQAWAQVPKVAAASSAPCA